MQALFDLECLAEEHEAWRASDVGIPEPSTADTAARLSHAINAREAAEMLGVTDRRVRQLCAFGLLDSVGLVDPCHGSSGVSLVDDCSAG